MIDTLKLLPAFVNADARTKVDDAVFMIGQYSFDRVGIEQLPVENKCQESTPLPNLFGQFGNEKGPILATFLQLEDTPISLYVLVHILTSQVI